MSGLRKNIEDTITRGLAPDILEVIDESHHHNVPSGAESHFKITVISAKFKERTLLERHRLLHALLKEYLSGGVHAVALHAYTPDEWMKRNRSGRASPPCMGGSQKKA